MHAQVWLRQNAIDGHTCHKTCFVESINKFNLLSFFVLVANIHLMKRKNE